MSSFAERLAAGPCLLLDGGMGTLLMVRGLPAGTPPESWNLDRPAEVVEAHRAYVDAGSEAVHTNTFGGHPLRLARFGLADRAAEIQAAGARLARSSGARYVVGDLGPTGEYLPPVGDGDPERWREGFALLAAALAAAGADALHLETMTDRREAGLALAAARAAAPALPVLVSLTFERRKRGFFTVMGDPLIESLRELAEAGAAAVGANCTLASADMAVLAAAAAEAIVVPRVWQPNAGQPEMTAEGAFYAQAPDEFARQLAPLAERGLAAALGGCCGTDPRFIAALAARLGRPPCTS